MTSPGVFTALKWPTKRHVRTGFLSHDPETWQSLFSVSSRRGAESVPRVNYSKGFIQEANDTKAEEAGHPVRFGVSCCLAGWMFLFFPIENEVPYLFSTSLHQESDIFFLKVILKGRVVGKSMSRDCRDWEGTPSPSCITAPSSSSNIIITTTDTTCTSTAAAEGALARGWCRLPVGRIWTSAG